MKELWGHQFNIGPQRGGGIAMGKHIIVIALHNAVNDAKGNLLKVQHGQDQLMPQEILVGNRTIIEVGEIITVVILQVLHDHPGHFVEVVPCPAHE